MKQKQFKRCPRCDSKVPIFQDRCEGCGLIFSRLSKASNSAAKKAIKKKEYNKVIMDKVLPVDVSKGKLLLTAIFFGWFGGHYAKVGRYNAFTYMIISLALLYVAVFLPYEWFSYSQYGYLSLLMWALVFPGSFGFMFWVVSVFQIIFNKFKVPISIDEELVKQSLDNELVQDILQNVKIEKENFTEKQEKLKKGKKIKVTCSSCGAIVKVYETETICPKCDEPLKD